MANQVVASPQDIIDTTSAGVATPPSGTTTLYTEGGMLKSKNNAGIVINYAGAIFQIDGGNSSTTFITSENIDGGTA